MGEKKRELVPRGSLPGVEKKLQSAASGRYFRACGVREKRKVRWYPAGASRVSEGSFRAPRRAGILELAGYGREEKCVGTPREPSGCGEEASKRCVGPVF